MMLQDLRHRIFVELADNEYSNCRRVVRINSAKRGRFMGASYTTAGTDWLLGAVQKLLTIWCSYNKYMVCYKDHKKCAYQSIIKGFSLT